MIAETVIKPNFTISSNNIYIVVKDELYNTFD